MCPAAFQGQSVTWPTRAELCRVEPAGHRPQEPASESSRPNIKHLLSSVVRSTKYKREKAPTPGSSVEAAGRSRRAQASNTAHPEHSTLS